jgi:protein involved in polysaccharide export with SLBB domain
MEDRPAETPPAKGPGQWAGAYKLGPGDVLNIALQGQAKTRKNGIEIGPDGTLSFLEARRIEARGKSIPELRSLIEEALTEYHEDVTILLTPVALKSKRYTILGKVRKSGSYSLTRPTTLLEAIASSGGFVIGASRLSVSQLADLRRSFVVRAGKKLGLDLERLYAQGDLSQNVFLEPGDYIYIASNVDQQCYVLGSVNQPGEVPLDTPLTVTGAIAAAKGFGEKAWKARVLLVRGNLSNPVTETVDMRAIFEGRAKDVAVAPGDIVYISNRPWALAEDLLDAAIRSFIQGSAAAAFETRTSISVGR